MREKLISRLYKRFKTGDKCSAKLLLSDDVTIKDISLGGVLLETTKRLDIDSSYRIQIGYKNDETIMPIGLVVRASLKGTKKKKFSTLPLYQTALRFIELNDTEKRFIDKLISEFK